MCPRPEMTLPLLLRLMNQIDGGCTSDLRHEDAADLGMQHTLGYEVIDLCEPGMAHWFRGRFIPTSLRSG